MILAAAPHAARRLTPRTWSARKEDECVLEKEYSKVRFVSQGAAGKIYEGRHRKTGEMVAIKELPSDYALRRQVRREAEALRKASSASEFVCAFKDYQESKKSVYLITEYLKGGDLLDVLNRSQNGLSELCVKTLIKQVATALAGLHSQELCHLDLKCENICLSDNSFQVCKLVDFGSARYQHSKYSTLSATTIANAPPEVFVHGEVHPLPTVDIWALGIITYLLLTGSHPFDLYATQNDDSTVANILAGFDASQAKRLPAYLRLSPHAQHFISCCLSQMPANRPPSNEILQHPWFCSLSS